MRMVLKDRYEIREKLGEGGMGVVYKAYDTYFARLVAIKALRMRGLSDQEESRRFQREFRALAKLDHPNVVKVYDLSLIHI